MELACSQREQRGERGPRRIRSGQAGAPGTAAGGAGTGVKDGENDRTATQATYQSWCDSGHTCQPWRQTHLGLSAHSHEQGGEFLHTWGFLICKMRLVAA